MLGTGARALKVAHGPSHRPGLAGARCIAGRVEAVTSYEANWPRQPAGPFLRATAAKVLGALKTKCTFCDDRHICSRKDALSLDQEIGKLPLNPQETEPCLGVRALSSPLTAPPF